MLVVWVLLSTVLVDSSSEPNATADPPLVSAIIDNDFRAVAEMVKAGVDPNARGRSLTALFATQEHIADSTMRHGTLQKLLVAGALPDLETKDGSTPLMLAAFRGDMESVAILLEFGANPLLRNSKGHHAVSAAEEGGHVEVQHMLRDWVGESGVRWASLNEETLKVEL